MYFAQGAVVVEKGHVRGTQVLTQLCQPGVFVARFVEGFVVELVGKVSVHELIGAVACQLVVVAVRREMRVPAGRGQRGSTCGQENAGEAEGERAARCPIILLWQPAALSPGDESRENQDGGDDQSHVVGLENHANHFVRVDEIIDGDEVEVRMELRPVEIERDGTEDHEDIQQERQCGEAIAVYACREKMLRYEQVNQRQQAEEHARTEVVDEAETKALYQVGHGERGRARRTQEHDETREHLYRAPAGEQQEQIGDRTARTA